MGSLLDHFQQPKPFVRDGAPFASRGPNGRMNNPLEFPLGPSRYNPHGTRQPMPMKSPQDHRTLRTNAPTFTPGNRTSVGSFQRPVMPTKSTYAEKFVQNLQRQVARRSEPARRSPTFRPSPIQKSLSQPSSPPNGKSID